MHLGKQRLSEEWSRFTQGRPGAPRGPRDPDVDKILLEEWDRRASQRAPDERRRLAKVNAEDDERGASDWATELRDRLHGTAKKAIHAGAVEQRIRRALRQRDEWSATDRWIRSVRS